MNSVADYWMDVIGEILRMHWNAFATLNTEDIFFLPTHPKIVVSYFKYWCFMMPNMFKHNKAFYYLLNNLHATYRKRKV